MEEKVFLSIVGEQSIKVWQVALEEVFGFKAMRAGQELLIDLLLLGRSAMAIFPTGGGKSLCYQLPALLLEGTAVVISPLLALMKDQVDSLVAKGVAAARLDSTMDAEAYGNVVHELQAGRLKLLYISPEKFGNTEFRKLLRGVKISLIAVDEAHCISEWGHNFRPDYLKVAKIRKQLGVKRFLALTATATPKVEADLRRIFSIAKSDVVKLSFHRPNLDLRITPCASQEKKQLLLNRLVTHGRPAVVYVTRQETAEEVATFLCKQGMPAKAYHAGLRSELRREIQEAFMGGETNVVVATIAFGMGVDKADVRTVIHYNMPKSIEGYTQEIGRAGRDGHTAVCEWLACGNDQIVLENFIYSDTPSRRSIRNLLERILLREAKFDISLYDLSLSCDVRERVTSTILAYLEMAGVIEARGSFYDRYELKLLYPLSKIFAGRKGKERILLQKIFEKNDAEWKIFRVNLSEMAEEISVPNQRLRELIEELEKAGEIRLKKSQRRQAYRLKRPTEGLQQLSEEIVANFQKCEASDIARLQHVLALSEKKSCITAAILKHFGEKMAEPCGHCDRCRGMPPSILKKSKPRRVSDDELLVIRSLADQRHAALATSRQLARFLCGMSSPASFRARLYRVSEYGMLADIPFGEVLILAESFFKD